MKKQKTAGFIPIKFVELGKEQLMVRFIDLCGTTLTEPFFSETVIRLINRKAPQIIVPFSELSSEKEIRQPAGFIFHCSRSGSTLIAQALANCSQCRVVSEAEIINQLLLSQNLSPETKAQAIRGIINCFYSPSQPKLVIKFSSWSVVFMDFIRKIYPTVPMIFLYRDPVEVLVSWESKSWPWLMNKAIIDQLLTKQMAMNVANIDSINYQASLLQAILEFGYSNLKNTGIPINYCQLPEIIGSDFFDLGFTDDNIACMSERVKYSAKSAQKHIFVDDSQEKRKRASVALLEAHAKYTDAIYQKLETARLTTQN
jgi:hypothetical protein